MADYLTTDTELASVASAIRTKGGTSSPLVYPAGFVNAINAIPTGGGGDVTDISSLLAISDGESPYSASSIKQLKGYKIGDTFYVVAALSPDLENGGYGVVIEAEDLPTEGYQFYMSVSSAAYYELYDEHDGPSYYVINGVDEVDTEFHNSNPGSFRAVIDIDSNAPEGGVLVVNLCFLPVDY